MRCTIFLYQQRSHSPMNISPPSRSVAPIIRGTFANLPCLINTLGSSVKKAPSMPGASRTGVKGSGLKNGLVVSYDHREIRCWYSLFSLRWCIGPIPLQSPPPSRSCWRYLNSGQVRGGGSTSWTVRWNRCTTLGWNDNIYVLLSDLNLFIYLFIIHFEQTIRHCLGINRPQKIHSFGGIFNIIPFCTHQSSKILRKANVLWKYAPGIHCRSRRCDCFLEQP